MKYYTEHFGLSVDDKGLPTIQCVCRKTFSLTYEEVIASELNRCPYCDELWYFKFRKDYNRYLLIRPKTNNQIWW